MSADKGGFRTSNCELEKMKRLRLHPQVLPAVKPSQPLGKIRAGWESDEEEFAKRRAKFLLDEWARQPVAMGIAERAAST